jgi:hypothetical protein
MVFYMTTPLGDYTANGTLLNLKFNVASDAPQGTTVAISLSKRKGLDLNFSNFESQAVPVNFVAGGIYVEPVVVPPSDPTAADLNYDTSSWRPTYDGSAKSVSVTPKAGIGAVTVYYNGSTTAPTNAGTYPITVSIAASDGYNAATGISLGDLEILKAPAPSITWPTAASIAAGDTLADSALSFTSNDYGTFAWEQPSYAPTASGAYAVVFTPSASTLANYETIATTSMDVQVTVVTLGDIDADGYFTAADALRALYAANELITLTGDQALAADVDGDDAITSADVILIAKLALKI